MQNKTSSRAQCSHGHLEGQKQFCKCLDINRLTQNCGVNPLSLLLRVMIMCSSELVKDICMHVDTGPGSSKIVFTFICKAITDSFFSLCLIT